MKHGVTRALWVWSIGTLLVAGGYMALSNADGANTVPKPEGTDAPVFLSQATHEAITITSPILMVWRDSATGKLGSRTLPPETKAHITANHADSSRNAPVTMPLQTDSQAVVAMK